MTDAPWTCPFCSLLCDGFHVDVAADAGGLALRGSDCPRARAGLSHFQPDAAAHAVPTLLGEPVSLDAAIGAAAQRLTASRLPLVGGLATDVAGARALYRLAARLGAVSDHAHGDALHVAARAQQDRGVFYTTLAEVRNRADLVVCFGTSPAEHYPEFFRRCGIGQPDDLVPGRQVVFVGAAPDAALLALPGLQCEAVELQGDLFETLALLNALAAQRRVTHAGLGTLAARLRAARYAVLVWEPARLPPDHGALLAEGLQRLVATLNEHTRAATFSLGGSEGGYTAQQVYTWLSGLPLRTHAGPRGLEHDPLRHGTRRLLQDGAVDALLWVQSFGPQPAPPASPPGLPLVLLAHPQTPQPAGDVVFIPVATPGINADGHLFRTDGGVVLPLRRVRDDGLPTVAEVVQRIGERLPMAATSGVAASPAAAPGRSQARPAPLSEGWTPYSADGVSSSPRAAAPGRSQARPGPLSEGCTPYPAGGVPT